MAIGEGVLPTLNSVAGFRLATVSAGIKKVGRPDVVLMEICDTATIAGVFTKNAFCAAPVQVAKKHLTQAKNAGAKRYFITNTGNANAGTGVIGLKNAEQTCEAFSQLAGVDANNILPFSTGVIGEHLPLEKIAAVLPAAYDALSEDAWVQAANGILTTDTRPKGVSRTVTIDGHSVTLTGITKGAGMIKPNMATMLGYVATDAQVSADDLQDMLTCAVNHSFNRISIDGDTSTNDCCMLVATGKGALKVTKNTEAYLELQQQLNDIFIELACEIVKDGEGASKFVTITVSEGNSDAECAAVAFTVAESPLVKTALFASDPNWGRVLAAIGRAPINNLNVNDVSLLMNGVTIAENGQRAASYTEEQGKKAMQEAEIVIEIKLNRGSASATVWTCDFSYDYVRINAEYRS